MTSPQRRPLTPKASRDERERVPQEPISTTRARTGKDVLAALVGDEHYEVQPNAVGLAVVGSFWPERRQRQVRLCVEAWRDTCAHYAKPEHRKRVERKGIAWFEKHLPRSSCRTVAFDRLDARERNALVRSFKPNDYDVAHHVCSLHLLNNLLATFVGDPCAGLGRIEGDHARHPDEQLDAIVVLRRLLSANVDAATLTKMSLAFRGAPTAGQFDHAVAMWVGTIGEATKLAAEGRLGDVAIELPRRTHADLLEWDLELLTERYPFLPLLNGLDVQERVALLEGEIGAESSAAGVVARLLHFALRRGVDFQGRTRLTPASTLTQVRNAVGRCVDRHLARVERRLDEGREELRPRAVRAVVCPVIDVMELAASQLLSAAWGAEKRHTHSAILVGNVVRLLSVHTLHTRALLSELRDIVDGVDERSGRYAHDVAALVKCVDAELSDWAARGVDVESEAAALALIVLARHETKLPLFDDVTREQAIGVAQRALGRFARDEVRGGIGIVAELVHAALARGVSGLGQFSRHTSRTSVVKAIERAVTRRAVKRGASVSRTDPHDRGAGLLRQSSKHSRVLVVARDVRRSQTGRDDRPSSVTVPRIDQRVSRRGGHRA